MPGTFGNRRIEAGLGMTSDALPPETYTLPQRYAISLLGIVVAVQSVPFGVQPVIQLGQLATLSLTLKIGDKV